MSLKISKNSILFRGEIYTVTWEQQDSKMEPSMGKILAGIKQNLDNLEKEQVIILSIENEMVVTVKQQKPSDRENFKQRLTKKKRKGVKL